MPTSFSQSQSVTCPQCSHIFEAEIWLIVDSSERPDLIEKINKKTLHTVFCPWCRFEWEQDSSILVFRPDKTPHMFYAPSQNVSRRDFEQEAARLVERLRTTFGAKWQDEWSQSIQTTSHRFISAELSDDRVVALQEQAQDEIERLQREDPDAFRQLSQIFQTTAQNPTLLQQMQDFIQATTWEETKHILERDPQLLGDEGWDLLEGMLRIAELQHDNVGTNLLRSQLSILRVCRKIGLEKGIELLIETKVVIERIGQIPSGQLEALNQAVLTFVDAKIWEKYELLTRKPELLSDLADDVLLLLIGSALNEGEDGYQLAFERNRELLSKCREMGVEKGFSEVIQFFDQFKIPHLGLPLQYKLKLMQLSEEMSLDNPDTLAKSFTNAYQLLNTHRRLSADFEGFDSQALSFIEEFWKHILGNPDLTKAPLDFQGYVWRVAGALYDNLYQVSSNLEDLERSMSLYRKSAATGALPPQDLFFVYSSLSNVLDRRYEHLGLPSDLNESIQSAKQAIQIAEDHNLEELGFALSLLGDSLRKLYWQTNKIEHLEEAAKLLQRAIELLRSNSTYTSVYYEALNNLSNIYGDLFEITGLFENLNLAIRTIETVINAVPHSPFLNNYANLLMDRYDHVGKVDDLDRAIHAYEDAINNISPNHHMTSTIYGNLGRALLSRYGRTEQAEDIRRAIALSRKAVKMLPEDAPGLAGIMQALSSCLLQRFLHMKKKRRIILDEAVRCADKAIGLTKPESPDYSRYHTTLGNCLKARYEYTLNLADLTAATDTYRKGCESGIDTLPLATWASAQNWGQWAFQRREWAEVNEALGYARRIVENLISNQTLREDKANWIGQIGNLYVLFAYANIKLGNVALAVEAIEEGRTQLMRETLERQRKDFEHLPDLGFRELYDRFATAVFEEQELQRLSPEHRKNDWLAHVRAVRREIREVAQAIREEAGAQHPEYRFFLRSLPFEEIQKQAQATPLIYLFATPLGSMALVVRSQGAPQIIEFPEITDQALWEHVVGYPGVSTYFHTFFPWRAQPENPIALENWKVVLDTTLSWLWQTIMGPLASGLNTETNLTLIPSGLLELLPLQAAWHLKENTESSRHYFLDQFTVAYAPSAQALYHAEPNAHRPIESMLAVENPDGELTYSRDAVQFAQSLFRSSRVLQKKLARRETVIREIGKYSVLYFFTHGVANFEQPLESGLLLANEEFLTLRDMFDIHTEQARLAVLSACESGLPVDLKQLDEVVSLPSGLIQAGIPGVLGSYWPVLEVSTAILMTIFFDQWRKHNLPAPLALKRAQIILRDAAHDPSAREYFRDALEEYTASPIPGADVLYKHMHTSNFEHPFYWAAFAYHGM